MGSSLQRSAEGVRNRLRDYLKKLSKKDKDRIIEQAGKDPNYYSVFENDADGKLVLKEFSYIP